MTRQLDSRDGYVYPPFAQVGWSTWVQSTMVDLHTTTWFFTWVLFMFYLKSYLNVLWTGTRLVDRVVSIGTCGYSQHCHSFTETQERPADCLPSAGSASETICRMGTKVLYLSVYKPLPWARNPKPSFYNNTFLASVFLHKQNLNRVVNTGRTGLPKQCRRARRISHSTTASTTASAMARVLEMSPTPAAWRTVLNIVAKKKLQIVDKLLMFLPELKVLQLKMTRSSRRVKMTMETEVIAPQRREHSFEQNWVGAGDLWRDPSGVLWSCNNCHRKQIIGLIGQCHIWNP